MNSSMRKWTLMFSFFAGPLPEEWNPELAVLSVTITQSLHKVGMDLGNQMLNLTELDSAVSQGLAFQGTFFAGIPDRFHDHGLASKIADHFDKRLGHVLNPNEVHVVLGTDKEKAVAVSSGKDLMGGER